MKKVYVAGPISKGNTMHNVHMAISVADELMARGYCPFVPHVTCLWDIVSPHTYEEWCAWDDEWLRSCDAVLRISGESLGADAEVELAKKINIPVFYAISQLEEHFRGSGVR